MLLDEIEQDICGGLGSPGRDERVCETNDRRVMAAERLALCLIDERLEFESDIRRLILNE